MRIVQLLGRAAVLSLSSLMSDVRPPLLAGPDEPAAASGQRIRRSSLVVWVWEVPVLTARACAATASLLPERMTTGAGTSTSTSASVAITICTISTICMSYHYYNHRCYYRYHCCCCYCSCYYYSFSSSSYYTSTYSCGCYRQSKTGHPGR